MKKLLSLLLSLSMMVTVVMAEDPYTDPYDALQETDTYYSFAHVPEENTVKTDGTLDFRTVVSNFDFKDLSASYKKSATELAALGIVSGAGKNYFDGRSDLSKIQTLTMMIRLMGKEKELQEKVKREHPDIPSGRLTPYFQDEYVDYAFTNGIIESKSIRYNDKITREEMASMLVKATKINSEKKLAPILNDRETFSIGTEEAIDTVLNYGIMTSFPDGNFRPKDPVKREHFAKILATTISLFPELLQTEKKYGSVVGIQSQSEEGNQYSNLILKNMDGELEIIRYGKLNNGQDIGFPVLNGALMYPASIRKGMDLEYLVKDGKIILVTVLHNDKVKDAIVQKYLSDEKVLVLQGVVKSNTNEKIHTDQEQVIRTRLRVELDDDRMVDFLQERDRISNIDNEIPVMGEKGYFPLEGIKKGDKITAYVKDQKVLFIKLGAGPLQKISGILRQIEDAGSPDGNGENQPKSFLRIYSDTGQLHEVPINEYTRYSVNDYIVGSKDLKIGMRVTAVVLRGNASFVAASSYQAPSGYIPKQGKIEFVTLKTLQEGTFTVEENASTYRVFENVTEIKKNGKPARWQDFRSGDKLKLFFDDIYGKAPSKIEILQAPSLVQDIIKGKIVDYSNATGHVSVEELMRMTHTNWAKMPDHLKKFKLEDGAELYSDGKKIPMDALNPKSGDRVYLVLRDGELTKAVFAKGSERNFSNAVRSFNNVLQNLELNNGRNFNFGEDTIFVESGRLVSKENLGVGKTVQVVTNDSNGSDAARVVQILDRNYDFFDRVYIASIEDVDDYSVSISNYFHPFGMAFSSIEEGEKGFELYNESSIYDSDKKAYIDHEDFFHGDYYRKRYKEKNDRKYVRNKGLEYKRYYGVFFVDEREQLIASKIRHKGLYEGELLDDKLRKESEIPKELDKIRKRLSFSRGTIDEFFNDWQKIGLRDSFQYFEFDGKWKANRKRTVYSVRDALIIKNNEAISYQDLRIDDKVYAIRDDEKVLFLYVED